MSFATAGPPPPLIVPGRGTPQLLEGVTPPLGVSDLPVHPETVVDFPPGTAIVLYTDGLVERRGEGVDTGLKRLVTAAGGTRGGPEAPRDRVPRRRLGPPGGAGG